MQIKFKADQRIRGLVRVKKADFSYCKSINCKALELCSKVKPEDIICSVHPGENPVNITLSEPKDMELEEDNKYLAWLKNFLIWNKFKNQFHNAITTEYLENIQKHLAGTSTPVLAASYCGLSSAFDAPTKASTLILELGRVTTSPVRTGTQVVCTSSFGLTDANCLATTVSAVTSTTVFTLTSVVGLQVGDRIRLTLSGASNRKEQRKITNIAGSIITVSEAFTSTITIGDTAEQMISRIHLVNGSATSTLNSGSSISIAGYIDTKISTQTVEVENTITNI
jgi:hypothetical protein